MSAAFLSPTPRPLTLLLRLLVAVLVAGWAVGAPVARASDASDPPARAGKISLLSGQVTQTDIRSGEQQDAALNWPLTSGQRLSTGRLARAEVRIGSLALRMDEVTDVDFARIDDELIQLVVLRGTATLRVRNRELLNEIDLLTPRERIVLDDVGRYRIDVDQAPGITAVTVEVGYARIGAGRMTFAVQSGQRGEVSSQPTTGFVIVAPSNDQFDDWVAQRDRRDDVLASSQFVSRETTGIEALDEYGSWRTVPDYGPVWFPSFVPSGWAPFRHGRWAYVSPWGWTWIDEAPWGFAPFHYGRWALVGGRWCWVPGAYVARPVFAPALVAWYGAPGISISVGFGNAIGWFPLGPGEVYIPPYAHSRRYITRINYQHVRNINQITVINPPPRFVHQTPRTATWAPDDAVVRARPIQRVVKSPPPDEVTRLPASVALPPPLRRSPDAVAPAPRGVAAVERHVPGARPPKLDPAPASAAPGRAIAPASPPVTRVQPPPSVAEPALPPATNVPRPLPPAARGLPPGDDHRLPKTVRPVQPVPPAVVPPPVTAPSPSTPNGEAERGRRIGEPNDFPRRIIRPEMPQVPPPAVPAPVERPQPRIHVPAPVPQQAPMPKIERPERAAPPNPGRSNDGPRNDGPRNDGPRNDGPRFDRGEQRGDSNRSKVVREN